jgi:crotonobetainyl-CoA:carnitine CoA-transferase CaiB-like acyl-CoA transferase
VWQRFCDAIGQPEWKEKSEWSTRQKRTENRKAVNDAISAITKHKPSVHWVELFEEAGVPCGPIYTIDQTFADPQVQHLGIAAPVTHPVRGDFKIVGSPLNMSDVTKKIRRYTPDAGEHTDEILRSFGYSDDQVQQLRASGVVR